MLNDTARKHKIIVSFVNARECVAVLCDVCAVPLNGNTEIRIYIECGTPHSRHNANYSG